MDILTFPGLKGAAFSTSSLTMILAVGLSYMTFIMLKYISSMPILHQGCILSPCLFNLYAEYIMRNAGLEEAQSGIKTARRNINNLRYADDTTLMAESEEELKKPLDESERRE